MRLVGPITRATNARPHTCLPRVSTHICRLLPAPDGGYTYGLYSYDLYRYGLYSYGGFAPECLLVADGTLAHIFVVCSILVMAD